MPTSRPPHVRRAPLRALTVALAAVLGLALAGCQDLGPDRARVAVRYQELLPLGRERLVLTLQDGERQFYLEGIDLEPAADGWLASRELRVANGGTLRVRVALRGTGGTSVSTVDVDVPLAPHARWRLDVFPSSASLAAACGGCTGVQRATILQSERPSARDWLYVTWTAVAP
jgi:hypothetical protein